MTTILTISERASDFIQQMLEKNPGSVFRLSVKKTGCSGYSYLPSLSTTVYPDDVVQQTEKGVCIYIDPTWRALLEGIQIDYVEDNNVGIKQKKLVFINPKEASRCGCGESFHLE